MIEATAPPASRSRIGFFNVPLAGSFVDAIFMIACIVATAYLWYNARGIDKIDAARARVGETAEATRANIDDKKASILVQRTEIAAMKARRDSLERLATRIKQVVIPREIEAISAAQEKNQQLTNEFLTLRGRVGNSQDLLRELTLQVEDLTASADALAQDVAVMQDTVFASDQRRQALAFEVEEMVAYRERDPWSVFPVSASLSAYLEFGEDADFLTFSLAKDFFSGGKIDFGAAGALGFGNEQGTSIREIGVYANFELWFRRASLDLGAGFSSVRIGTDNNLDDPYVSLMLRFAPYYRERAFLLLGTKYSHDALSYLVGIGFGRR